MITIYSYDIAKGILERPTPEALPELLDREDVDLWVDLEAPTPGESEILRTVFNFHELAIEDCTEANIEEAKLDDYEDYLFLVTHPVFFKAEMLEFSIIELDLFFGKNYVVTYHKKPTPGINQLQKRLERAIDFMALGTDEILHALIDSFVDNYVTMFKHIERTIYRFEAEILSNPKKKTFNDLFKLKIGLINLSRILIPEEEMMETLGETEHPLIQEENLVYFQDIHDHISTIKGLHQSYMQRTTTIIDTYMSLSTHRMNSTMQVLTVIATIVLIPTLIASIYGMNFDYMPFLHHPHGFFFISMMGLILAGIMLWYFKIKDWF